MKNYKDEKLEILEMEPVYKRVDIKKIHIPQNGIIDINGKPYRAKQSFVGELAEEIGISENAITQLRKNLDDDEINTILNKSFSNYFKRRPAITRNIIGERQSANLFRLSKGEIIPFSTIFDAIEKIKDKFNDLIVEYKNHQLRIVFIGQKIDIDGFKNEDFHSNFGLQYSYGKELNHIKIMERIFCTNQISSNIFRHPENNLAAINSPFELYRSIANINHENLEKEYIDLVKRIQTVYASIREYEKVYRILSRFISKDNNYLYNKLLQKDAYDLFVASDIDKETETTPKDKQFTPIKYWDIINGITDFASHDYYTLTNKERDELKQKAFTLLKQTPDMIKYRLN